MTLNPDNDIKSGKPASLSSFAIQFRDLQSVESGSKGASNEAKQVLHERAIALAHSPQEVNADAESLEVVEFMLSNECYAFVTGFLREIHPVKEISFLPGSPSFVSGLVNIRGQIIVVINLKMFFELQDVKCNGCKQVLVVESAGRQIGILADAVHHIKRISLVDLQGPLATLSGVKSEFVQGITNDRTVLLDANRLILSEKLVINDNKSSLNSSIGSE